ncbi:MAG: N-acetylmuramoyl-L-alanine amidase [Bacteroidota bacterium]
MKKIENQFILMDTATFTEWLNDQKIGRKIKRIQNHHTWKPDYSNFRGDNHFNLLKGMRNSHLKRGFSDIAQNITTFPDGTLAVCRPLSRTPAGIKGANSGGICIEHVGNFDEGKDQMTEAHKTTILYLNALFCSKFGLEPNADSIVYHHWWDLKTARRKNGEGSTKSCPGTGFFGGNKVGDALNNFIPEIKTFLEETDLACA